MPIVLAYNRQHYGSTINLIKASKRPTIHTTHCKSTFDLKPKTQYLPQNLNLIECVKSGDLLKAVQLISKLDKEEIAKTDTNGKNVTHYIAENSLAKKEDVNSLVAAIKDKCPRFWFWKLVTACSRTGDSCFKIALNKNNSVFIQALLSNAPNITEDFVVGYISQISVFRSDEDVLKTQREKLSFLKECIPHAFSSTEFNREVSRIEKTLKSGPFYCSNRNKMEVVKDILSVLNDLTKNPQSLKQPNLEALKSNRANQGPSHT